MAKSKSGGARAYLRGRIGSDVYSVGKDGKGKKQQVVRSLAESVKNPQTLAQMKGRAIMSTIMQAVSAMSQIIDHSFETVPYGQPNISEFIKVNYALVKADVEAHPSGDNAYGINKYGEKGVLTGDYVIARGSAVFPYTATLLKASVKVDSAATATFQDILDELGISGEDYITLCGFVPGEGFKFVRLSINPAAVLSTVATDANIETLFQTEGTGEATFAIATNKLTISLTDSTAGAVILSKKVDSVWKRNDASITGSLETSPQPYDTAIATYPTGSEMFLNGGEM